MSGRYWTHRDEAIEVDASGQFYLPSETLGDRFESLFAAKAYVDSLRAAKPARKLSLAVLTTNGPGTLTGVHRGTGKPTLEGTTVPGGWDEDTNIYVAGAETARLLALRSEQLKALRGTQKSLRDLALSMDGHYGRLGPEEHETLLVSLEQQHRLLLPLARGETGKEAASDAPR